MQRGFTLLELMIVVAIGGVLAMIAVPALRDTLQNTRQSSAVGLLVNDLNQARGEAIKRNRRVIMCVRDPAGTPDGGDLCAASTDWRGGWVVCTQDPVANQCAEPTADNPNPVVVIRDRLDPSLTLAVLDATNTATGLVRFNANSSQGTNGSAVSMTLGGTWAGAATRTVVVQGTGNISKQ